MKTPGGKKRLRAYADNELPEELIDRVHHSKEDYSQFYSQSREDIVVALITTTTEQNIKATDAAGSNSSSHKNDVVNETHYL